MRLEHSPFASEMVLYRTHSEIISNHRLVINGRTLLLSQVQGVQLVRSRYFALLQVLRVALIGAVLAQIAWCVQNCSGLSLTNGLLAAGPPVVLLWLVYMLPALIPSHALRLTTTGGVRDFMLTSDRDQLAVVQDKIEGACAALETLPG